MAAIALVAAPLLAEAQQPAAKKEPKAIPPGSTFRCVAKDGRKYFGSAIPPECQGQAIDVISPTGVMVMRIDPAAEEKERQARAAATAASAADAEAKKQREIANKDIERRHQAILATYTSEKEVQEARARALEENRESASKFEAKIAELRAKRARYEKELALYKDKKDEKSTSSSKVVEENIKVTDLDLGAQEQLLKGKNDEVPGINAKYDEELRRYKEAMQAMANR